MNYFIDPIKKYAEFTGRATRKEFWLFYLINFLISFVLGFVMAFITESTIVTDLYGLFLLMPSLAVGVRRLHDTGNTGWYILIPFANIIFLLLKGQKGKNEYGEDPRAQRSQ